MTKAYDAERDELYDDEEVSENEYRSDNDSDDGTLPYEQATRIAHEQRDAEYEKVRNLPSLVTLRRFGMIVLLGGFGDLANRIIHFANHFRVA